MILYRRNLSDYKRLAEYFPVFGIVGPRQIGKTFLVNQLRELLAKESVYLDLEHDSDQAKLSDPHLFLGQFADKTVILDEIHRMPGLLPVIRHLIDQNRTPGRFILVSSASPALIRDKSETGSNRIPYIELFPISICELPEGYPILEAWLKGGFPPLLCANTGLQTGDWTRNYVRNYVEKELQLLGLNVSPMLLERLWKMLAHLNGQFLNSSEVGNSIGLSVNTTNRYIDYLENAYLIRRVYPVPSKYSKKMVKAPKIYIRDTGVLHYLLRLPDFNSLLSHPVLGHSWECFVVQQIASNLPSNIAMYHYRTHNRAEADLVLYKGENPVTALIIQPGSSPILSRGNTLAITDLNAPMNFVITPSSDDHLFKERIRVCSLKTFILNYLPNL
jgi:predicted AAA+ superfamily ATPase